MMPPTIALDAHKESVSILESVELSSQQSFGELRSETSVSQLCGLKKDAIVDWAAPEDPSNPRNWTPRTKLIHVGIVSAFTFSTNVASIIFAPGAPKLVEEFAITSTLVASLTVSIYLLGTCIGPLFVAPLSEMYGRLIVYRVSSLLYEASTIGCALSTNTAMFLTFRCLAGCFGAVPMAIVGGTIADLYLPDERGMAMALFSLGPTLGPIFGPVVGGFLAETSGWRWTFWLIFILTGLSFIATMFLNETYEPILLARKAASLRATSGNDKLRPRTALEDITHSERLRRSVVRPMKMLIFSPIVLFISLYCAVLFGLQYLLYATYPTVFADKYGWGPSWSGLAYLGMGIGMLISVGCIGAVSDKKFKKAKTHGIVTKPEARLLPMAWTVPLVPLGCVWYGWAAQADNMHWIVPILGTSLIGFGYFAILMPSQVYLVDAFGTELSASALAANTFLRSLVGTLMPLGGPSLYTALNLGWGNTLLALICLSFAPVPWLLMRFGEKLRIRFPVDY